MSVLSVILLCVVLLMAPYYYWTFTYWKKKGIKHLKPNLFFGNLTNVILRKVPVYQMFREVYEKCKKCGDTFMGFYFLNNPALVICDAELVKNILIRDFNHFTDRDFYINEDDLLTVSIVSTKGDRWKKMREKLSPAFSPSKTKIMCSTLLKAGKQLSTVLDEFAENRQAVDLKDVSSKYLVDAIGMAIFGIECNTLQGSNMEFRSFAEKVIGGSFTQNIKLVVSLLSPSVLHFFKIPFFNTDIQNFYLNLIRDTVENREKSNAVRKDLMHSIIQLRNNISIEQEKNNFTLNNVPESEKTMKIEEITAQSMMFFGAAYETSAAAISLCIYELSVNNSIQKNLRDEISSVLKRYDGKICYDAIMEMSYLDKCVLETLRKYPVSMLSRICTKPYKIPNSDFILEKGSSVYIPIYQIHHDPEYYPNPDLFDPDRFSLESKANRPGFCYLSFGEGQRNCIGARLGALQIKIFVVTLLTNYTFTISSRTKFSSKTSPLSKSSLIASLDKPIYLNLEKIIKL